MHRYDAIDRALAATAAPLFRDPASLRAFHEIATSCPDPTHA
jgi:hypothetical protein